MQTAGLQSGLLEIFSAVSNYIKYPERNYFIVVFATTTFNYK